MTIGNNVTLSTASVNGYVVTDKSFTIIANDGSDAVTGRFQNLAEGAPLTLGGRPYAITYSGGDGNDVVLREGIAPTVESIDRKTPTTARTNADQVTYRVTFSEDVTRISAADFVLLGTAAADGIIGTPGAVTGSSVFDVTITGIANSNGTLILAFAAGQDITNVAGNPLASTTPGSSQSYTIDNVAPTFNSVLRQSPAAAMTSDDQVTFRVTFSDDMQNVDAGGLRADGNGGCGWHGRMRSRRSPARVSLMCSSPASPIATARWRIALSATHNITDNSGNLLSSTTPTTGETYQIANAGFVIVESGGSTSVSESGTTDTFTIALVAPPANTRRAQHRQRRYRRSDRRQRRARL